MKSDRTQERLARLVKERVEIVPYDPAWPLAFQEEHTRLLRLVPEDIRLRVEHIGSTAVPGCSAKPIIDIQVEVNSLDRVREVVVPVMEAEGYEFIWRPTIGEEAPFYAWFIKRNSNGERTHHIHMVESDKASEDRLLFRDHLCKDPSTLAAYEALKKELCLAHPVDRVRYTAGKTAFIAQVVRQARQEGARLD